MIPLDAECGQAVIENNWAKHGMKIPNKLTKGSDDSTDHKNTAILKIKLKIKEAFFLNFSPPPVLHPQVKVIIIQTLFNGTMKGNLLDTFPDSFSRC